jgi:hypothetical protein
VKKIDYKVKDLECAADSYTTYQDITLKNPKFRKSLNKTPRMKSNFKCLTFFAYSYPISESYTTNSTAQYFSLGPIKKLHVKIRISVTAVPKPNQ